MKALQQFDAVFFSQEFLGTVLLVVIFLPKEKDAFVFSLPIPIHVIKQL